MRTKVLMEVEEYLHTRFEPDCEYLEGGIAERNLGELEHGDTQLTVASLLRCLRGTLGIRVVTEIRIQINSTRYRVADIVVWRDHNIGTAIPRSRRSWSLRSTLRKTAWSVGMPRFRSIFQSALNGSG